MQSESGERGFTLDSEALRFVFAAQSLGFVGKITAKIDVADMDPTVPTMIWGKKVATLEASHAKAPAVKALLEKAAATAAAKKAKIATAEIAEEETANV